MGNSPGKNTGVCCHALLQGIFPTQGWNPSLLPCRRSLLHLSHCYSPFIPFFTPDSPLGNTPKSSPWSGRSRRMFPRTPSSFTKHKSLELPVLAAASWAWKILFKVEGTGWNFLGEGTLSKPRNRRKTCSWNCSVWPTARVNRRLRAKAAREGSMAEVKPQRALEPSCPAIQVLLIYLTYDNQVWTALFPAHKSNWVQKNRIFFSSSLVLLFQKKITRDYPCMELSLQPSEICQQ